MNELWSCVTNPGACIDGTIQGWINWWPFGLEGLKATFWLIIGAALGKWGVGAAVGLLFASKFAKAPTSEEQYPHPDIKPVGKKKGLWK